MKRALLFILITTIIAGVAAAQSVQPDGATVTPGTPETKTNATAGSVNAQGGNITPVDLAGETQTRNWQGFYGNVSGNLTLEDASGDQLFAWALAVLSGEIFASQDSSVDWTTIAGVTDCTTDETITGTSNDRVNNTYTLNNSVSFDVANATITSACQAFTYVNSAPQSTDFEAVILNATNATNTVYATRINASATAFDGTTTDYQLIVPANQTTLTYYFYVEFD